MVDIIIPMRNAVRTIPAAITSVAAQTALHRIHLIIVDDASTDGSLEAVASTLEALPQMEERTDILPLGERAGASAAYRAALGLARGRWLMRCDADDTLPSDAIERMLDCAESAGADIVAGAISLVDGAGETIDTIRPTIKGGLNAMRLDTPNFSLCNKLISRALLSCAPDGEPLATLPGIDCWDDLSLTARLMALPGVVVTTLAGDPVYNYRTALPGQSLSRAPRDYILRQHIECARLIDEWMEANGRAATFAPFILRLKFIAKVKLLRGKGSWGRIHEWQQTFPETTPYIMSSEVMGPDVSLPLRLAFRLAASL